MTLKYMNAIINGAKRDYKAQQLHRIFEKNLTSSNCANKKALIFKNHELTYNDLNVAANRMAALLLDQIHTCKLHPNQDGDWIIAVCMPPSNDFIITLLAILKTGAAYLPMDVTFPQNRIDHILHEANPTMVIYDSDMIERRTFGSTAAVSFAECKGLVSKYDCTNITDDRTLQLTNAINLALVLYTSGSTGRPKGVRLPHTAVMNRLQWQWETFPFSPTEQICAFKTAITFVDSLSEIWGPLLTKKSVLVVPTCLTKDPSQLMTMLQSYSIERLVVVPTLLKSILIYLSLQNDDCLLSNLKLWICSGETLSASLANEFFDYFPENEYMLCNFYGSTEIMGDVTYFICRGKDHLRDYAFNIPIGLPVFNTTIYILDSERKPVGLGETGELFVSGVNLAHGYVNGRDKEHFIENFMATDLDHGYLYQTGDYASVQEDGVIHYEGRTDSQVKIRGHRVDLSEIEEHLLEIDGIEKAVVLCNKAEFGQIILAFVSITIASILSPAPKSKKIAHIKDILRAKVAHYMMPQVFLVDEMPLLINGKIDRQSLLMMYSDMNNNECGIDYDFNGVLQSERQKAGALFETITEVIGRLAAANLSLDSNFFALGGNSLNSIYTIAKLRDRGYAIEIADFLSAKNLAEVLNGMNEINEDAPQIEASDKHAHFTIEPLKMEHKSEAIHMLACSFAEKNIIHRYMTLKIPYSAFVEDQNIAWDGYVAGGHSFIVKDTHNDTIIGVALNNDTDNKLKERPPTSIFADFSVYHGFLKTQIEDKIPKGKRILESCFVATHESLNAQENVMAVTFMESETVRLAKEHGFHAIISNNSHPLTQQLARYVFKYDTLFDYQINRYLIGDRRPFDGVPDEVHALVQLKTV